MRFTKSLRLVSTDKSAFSVTRARLCEKAHYLSCLKDRDVRYWTWLKRLENKDYSRRTRLLFWEIRSKNSTLETFNAIKDSDGSLFESHSDCLSYWAKYCQELYRGNDIRSVKQIHQILDCPISYDDFQSAMKSLKRSKAPAKPLVVISLRMKTSNNF